MAERKSFSVIGCDAGGTMTDVFLLSEDGDFFIGKAATTPNDESIGYMESLKDAYLQAGINPEEQGNRLLSGIGACVYSGTTMMNTMLQHKGRKTGLIVTEGFEDTFIQERGVQCWAGYSYQDRLHKITHNHNVPLIPRPLIKGVTERSDLMGRIVIPIYVEQTKAVIRELLDEGVEAIAVCFLWSFINPAHEKKVEELANEVFRDYGREVSVYLSSQVAPILMEHSRMNSVAIQAITSEVVRQSLFRIEKELKGQGYAHDLYIMTAGGGVVDIRYPKLVESVVSGPISGLMGCKYLSEDAGLGDYMIGTDLGGTSFDVGIITGGLPFTDREIQVARYLLNLPILTMHNIGSGLGSYLTVSERRELLVGPESAGSDPGPIAYDRGNEIPTMMDCHLILNHMNPNYYLGGKIKLNMEKAKKIFKEKIADPMGLDMYEAAEGAIRLMNSDLREAVSSALLSRGLHPADYYLVSYGGAGPMEMALYTEGIPYKGVFTVPFAAGFSAFGLLTDYAHKYQKSTLLMLPPRATDDWKMRVGQGLNAIWEELENQARSEMEKVGIPWEKVTVQPIVYVRYGSQLSDLETPSPVSRVNSPDDMDKIIGTFEALYEKAYTRVAKFPQAGYTILNAGLVASMPLAKPQLKTYKRSGKTPPDKALKGHKEAYWEGRWQKAAIYEMDLIEAGNEVEGFCIVEASNTTLIVPPGKRIVVDEKKLFWLK
jgi:acetone carboxylase, beta subunit